MSSFLVLRTFDRNCETRKLHHIHFRCNFLVYCKLRWFYIRFTKFSQTTFSDWPVFLPNFFVFVSLTLGYFLFSFIFFECENKFITWYLEGIFSVSRRGRCLNLLLSTLINLLFILSLLGNCVAILRIWYLRLVITHFQIEVLIIILLNDIIGHTFWQDHSYWQASKLLLRVQPKTLLFRLWSCILQVVGLSL